MSTISVYAFETHGDESATEWTTMAYSEAEEYAKQHGYSIIEREYEYSDSSLVADFRQGHDSAGQPVEGHVCGDPGQDDGLESHVGINTDEPWWVGRRDRDQLTGEPLHNERQDPLTGEWH